LDTQKANKRGFWARGEEGHLIDAYAPPTNQHPSIGQIFLRISTSKKINYFSKNKLFTIFVPKITGSIYKNIRV